METKYRGLPSPRVKLNGFRSNYKWNFAPRKFKYNGLNQNRELKT